jgi:predicted alpha/beta superfamily hydrolase
MKSEQRLIVVMLSVSLLGPWLFAASSNSAGKLAASSSPGQQSETQYPRVELKDTERRHLTSSYTDKEYEIDIFLPLDYRQSSQRYPAIYVLDAEYNFGCVAYIARRLIKNKDIPPVLLVGIAYDTDEKDYYARRMFDSTPESKIHGYGTGGARPFTQFVEMELIPFIDKEYRTIKDDRMIAGLSIAGFYCCYLLFKHPGLFKKFIIVSPSLWFSGKIAFEYEEEYFKKSQSLPAAVYLASGGLEGPNIKDNSIRLGHILEQRKYQGLKLRSVILEGEHHRSVFPLAFTRGLQFLMGQ